MIIHGLQKMSLLDFPGKMCCTVFTGGCDFRCPFCHNASLVLHPEEAEHLEESEFFSFLEKRVGWLDGVAITGGEPMMQKDLLPFAKRIKDLGFLVKLDTNGSYPERLREIVEAGVIDYVAMDIKNVPEFYGETVGIEKFDTANVEKSMAFLKENRVPYEFRTTVVKTFHSPERMEALAKFIGDVPAYFLQAFIDSDHNIRSGLEAYTDDEMKEIFEIVKKYIPSAQLRGVG